MFVPVGFVLKYMSVKSVSYRKIPKISPFMYKPLQI